MFALYIHVEIRKKKKQTVLSSLQACFAITPSSGDFVAKNIRNHSFTYFTNLHDMRGGSFNA